MQNILENFVTADTVYTHARTFFIKLIKGNIKGVVTLHLNKYNYIKQSLNVF